MIEFNKKDIDGNNITVKITTNNNEVKCKLYKETQKHFLFLNWTKTEGIFDDYNYLSQVAKWNRMDYEKWAEDCVRYVNSEIKRKREREATAEKIKRGKL